MPSAKLEIYILSENFEPGFQISTMSDLEAMAATSPSSTASLTTAEEQDISERKKAFLCTGACGVFTSNRICNGQGCVRIKPQRESDNPNAFSLALDASALNGIQSLDVIYNIRANTKSNRERIDVEYSFDGGSTYQPLDLLRGDDFPKSVWTEFTSQLDVSAVSSSGTDDRALKTKKTKSEDDKPAGRPVPADDPVQPVVESDSVVFIRFVSRFRRNIFIDNVSVIGYRSV
jgi:hypothetical protein